MNYVEEITLKQINNKLCIVDFVRFRESVANSMNDLYRNGFLDKNETAVFGNVVGSIRFSEYRDENEVWQHILRLRQFYDVKFYQAIYNTEKQVFYFDFKEDNKAIVRVFPMEDYRKIDPDMKMKEYDFGVLYVIQDDGTLLEDNEAVFKYIPDKTDGVITREEMISGTSFAKVKPANEIGLEECTVYEDDKNKILEYYYKVDKTNSDFKRTEKLSVTLNNVDTELEENREKIKILTENNEALSLKVNTLSKNIENKNKEIKELKKDNKHLEELVDYFKDLFDRLINFIKHKILGKDKEREDYWEFSKDLYEHGIFSEKTITDIKDDYDWNKENDKHKDHDDFDLEI